MEAREADALLDAVAPVAVYLAADLHYEDEAKAGFASLVRDCSPESVAAAMVEAAVATGSSRGRAELYGSAEGVLYVSEAMSSPGVGDIRTETARDMYNAALELAVLARYPEAEMGIRDKQGGLYASLRGTRALMSDDASVYGWFLSSGTLERYLSDVWG